MAGVFSLLIALSISLIVTRIAALALMFTGLSREAARFQARSAFSGVGFTTRESESIVNHPVRRRIVMLLMLLGNIGIATVIATVMISFGSTIGKSLQDQLLIFGCLTLGVTALFVLFSSRWVERQMNKLIARALQRFTDLEVRDYHSLLQLADGFAVSEMMVGPRNWLRGRRLKDLRLSDEGILVLGIHRHLEPYRGIPRADDTIEVNDVLILYGTLESIRLLDRRRSGQGGDKEHLRQVAALREQAAALDAADEGEPTTDDSHP